MDLDALELPYPYPEISTAEGLLVGLEKSELPNVTRLALYEVTDQTDVYEMRIILENYPWDIDEICDVGWFFSHANKALELLSLPLCEAWNTRKEGPAGKLQIAILQSDEDAILKVEITREEFEDVFIRVASSDFVQLLEDTEIIYVVNDVPGEDLEYVKDAFRRFYPVIHRDKAVAMPDEVELRALVNREQILMGYSEPDLGCFVGAKFFQTEEAMSGFLALNWKSWAEGGRVPTKRSRRRSYGR